MKANEYKCSICKQVFEKGLTEEEAVKQLEEEFGSCWKPEDCSLICDDCYKESGWGDE